MNSIKNFLKKLFYVEKVSGVPFGVTHLFGLKIRWNPDQTPVADVIAKQVAREVYSVMEVQYLHNRVFPQFKNINKDKDVVIYGCGPTLKYYNNEISGEKIALNKAILLDNVDFQYSFCIDANLLRSCPNYLEIIQEKKNCISFVGKPLHPERKQFPETNFAEDSQCYRFYEAGREAMPSRDFGKILYPNLENHPLANFESVAFPALHFAFYTHPRRIYFVGLDTSSGHFFDITGSYEVKAMMNGYRAFKNFAQLYYPDIEIISVNPVGLKGLFTDVYTKSYVDEHPELLNENVKIIESENCNAE